MNRFPSEDLHNSLLTSQDLAFSKEIQKKVSHDQLRGCYDDFEGYQTKFEVSQDYLSESWFTSIPHPTGHRFCLVDFESFLKPSVV